MQTRVISSLAACALTAACQRAEAVPPQQSQTQPPTQSFVSLLKSQPRPSEDLVHHVETLLAAIHCVGDIGHWSRSYAYDFMPERMIDTGIVDFQLKDAGRFGVKPGVQITYPDAWLNIDDGPYRVVSGDYDVREDRIRIAFCGNNMGERLSGDINNMGSYFEELKRRRQAHGTATPPPAPRDFKQLPLRPDNPTSADKAILEEAAEECHLHPSALTFVQYDVPQEPVIRTTRAFGDTDAQLACAVSHLPPEFNERFGVEFEPPK